MKIGFYGPGRLTREQYRAIGAFLDTASVEVVHFGGDDKESKKFFEEKYEVIHHIGSRHTVILTIVQMCNAFIVPMGHPISRSLVLHGHAQQRATGEFSRNGSSKWSRGEFDEPRT